MDSFSKIEQRMANGVPFTYQELRQAFSPNEPDTRAAEKTIQRWRRRGWIALNRGGGRAVWSLTAAGYGGAAARGPKAGAEANS